MQHPAEYTVSTKHIVQQTGIGSNSDTILHSLPRGPRVASCAINTWQSSIERKNKYNTKAGPFYKKEMGHSRAGSCNW